MKEGVCPHGVNKRTWALDGLPLGCVKEQARYFVVLNNESCPDCLRDRVANLRGVVELLLACVVPSALLEHEQRIMERAALAYYDDYREYLGPCIPNHLRVKPLPVGP